MMLLIDAAVGCLIYKVFGEQGLWALGMICGVTILRTAYNINAALGRLFSCNCEEEEEE